MKDTLKETPEQRLKSAFDKEIREIIKELKPQYVEHGEDFIRFRYAGLNCEITFKAKKI